MRNNDELFLQIAIEQGYLTTKQAVVVMQIRNRTTQKKQRFDLLMYLYTKKMISQQNLKKLKQLIKSQLETKKVPIKEQADNFLQKTLQDRYRIEEEIGKGASGVVYKAYDLSLKRYVAVKILPGAISEKDKQRFFLETESLAKLSCPHLVSLYNVYTTPYCFFVMELVEGGTLSKLISKKAYLDRNTKCPKQ